MTAAVSSAALGSRKGLRELPGSQSVLLNSERDRTGGQPKVWGSIGELTQLARQFFHAHQKGEACPWRPGHGNNVTLPTMPVYSAESGSCVPPCPVVLARAALLRFSLVLTGAEEADFVVPLLPRTGRSPRLASKGAMKSSSDLEPYAVSPHGGHRAVSWEEVLLPLWSFPAEAAKPHRCLMISPKSRSQVRVLFVGCSVCAKVSGC